MHENGTSNYFKAKVISLTTYLLNRCPTKSNHKITPKQLFSRVKHDLTHLKIFKCHVYIHVLKIEDINKLNAHVFVEYDAHSKTYKCYGLNVKKSLLV